MVATSAAVVELLKDIAERSLLRTQRPVLLAPHRLTSSLTDTAMVAWDESLQCWHAVSAAIPFLQRARSVEVVSVDRDAAGRKASQAEVLAYLRCHSIAATARVVAPDSRSVGETLLAEIMVTDAVIALSEHPRIGANQRLSRFVYRPVVLLQAVKGVSGVVVDLQEFRPFDLCFPIQIERPRVVSL